MKNIVLNEIYNSGANVVIFDIDGTLKDLCKEHSKALNLTLCSLKINRLQKKVILCINNIAMLMIKSGIFPTNRAKQNILLSIYSVLAIKNKRAFIQMYYNFYDTQLEIFDGVKELLSIVNKEKKVYYATINDQNYNLEQCGINESQIMYSRGFLKFISYKKLLDNLNVKRSEVIIVGDNIFDDILSAKLLKTKSLLVNNYNNKFKRWMCKILNYKYL